MAEVNLCQIAAQVGFTAMLVGALAPLDPLILAVSQGRKNHAIFGMENSSDVLVRKFIV